MKITFKSIIAVSIFALLSTSCSTKIDVNDLTGFWQGECGRGFQFTEKGTYFFYYIEDGTWKCSGDSENNFFVKGNELHCEWTENGEKKAICSFVDSFSKREMKLRSEPGDISDGKYVKVSEPSHIDVKDRKSALASSVLAEIDAFAERYWNAHDKSFNFKDFGLTDKEKLTKPNYLLDPSVANNLVTKSQKINALAMYVMDIAICKAYDMPYDDRKEAAIKLAAELNIPFDMEYSIGDEPVSEKIKATYKSCKERGDVSLFWQFQYAIIYEGIYILSRNPELFLSRITEEQWEAWAVVKETRLEALKELAKYDEEIAQFWELIFTNKPVDSHEDNYSIDHSLETAKQYYLDNKDRYTAMRNTLLQ